MNTSHTYLMHKATAEGTYAKLVDITSYPDLFAAPGKLDRTTLTNSQRVYEKDIFDVGDLVFGCLYDEADYDKVVALQDTTGYYQLQFGENGADGQWSWQGDIFFNVKGGGVGAIRTAEITCYPSTELVKG